MLWVRVGFISPEPIPLVNIFFYPLNEKRAQARLQKKVALSLLSASSPSNNLKAYILARWFPGEKLVSNLARFVVIVWVFVVLILTSSHLRRDPVPEALPVAVLQWVRHGRPHLQGRRLRLRNDSPRATRADQEK